MEVTKGEILNEVARCLLDDGEFDGEILRCLCCDIGHPEVSEEYSVTEEYALAAAIEYYDGDIEQAIATIKRGEYRHCPNVEGYEDLGREIFWQDMEDIGHEIPSYVQDYMDFETLGRDVSKDAEHGKFTHFGYFAPEKW